MKAFKITGFIKQKGKENEDWQPLGKDLAIQVPDNLNPYEVINSNFKAVASYWLYIVDEILKE